MSRNTPGPAQVTLVHAPACHFCEDARGVLTDLAGRYSLVVREVDIRSPEGEHLLATHRPAMSPLVLLDGAYFSSGRLPRRKLTAALDRRAATVPAGQG